MVLNLSRHFADGLHGRCLCQGKGYNLSTRQHPSPCIHSLLFVYDKFQLLDGGGVNPRTNRNHSDGFDSGSGARSNAIRLLLPGQFCHSYRDSNRGGNNYDDRGHDDPLHLRASDDHDLLRTGSHRLRDISSHHHKNDHRGRNWRFSNG
jgi:hypothetical protein